MTINKAKQILGKEAEKTTNEEIQVYINTAEIMSEIAIDQILEA